MSVNVENILRSHGIGIGEGTEVIQSITQPTTGLREGLFWYNTTSLELKMYVGGSFKSLSKFPVMTETLVKVVATGGATNIVFNIAGYNKLTDVLVVYQEEVRIHKGTHWNLNANNQSIDLIGYSALAGENFYCYVTMIR